MQRNIEKDVKKLDFIIDEMELTLVKDMQTRPI
jgi:hypothetical protein